jgi:hypothetical protein
LRISHARVAQWLEHRSPNQSNLPDLSTAEKFAEIDSFSINGLMADSIGRLLCRARS